MSKKESREQRLKQIKNRMTRRQFARFTALGAVSAAIASKGSATISLGNLTNAANSEYIGPECANFLKFIDYDARTRGHRYTIGELVYTFDFEQLLARLRTYHSDMTGGGYDPNVATDLQTLEQRINSLVGGGTSLKFHELFEFDQNTNPRGGTAANWQAVFSATSTRLRTALPTTYRQLMAFPNSHPSRLRISRAVTGIRSLSRNYFYMDLFAENVYTVFGGNVRDGVLRVSDYNAVREAFDCGLLGTSSTSFPRPLTDPAPLRSNDQCFSLGQNQCVSSTGDYCATENGVPTPSSDTCP